MFRLLFPSLALVAVVLAAGCGGGGGSVPNVVPTPGPAVTISPGPVSQTVTLTGAGYTLSFTLPATTSSSAPVTAYLAASPPPGVTVPQARTVQFVSKRPQAVGVPITALVYLVIKPSANLTFNYVPAFNWTLPSGTTISSGNTPWVTYYDPAQSSTGWIAVLGPGTASGQSVTFATQPDNVSYTGGQTYVYALVTAGTATPTPHPTPTVTPTPTPPPGPTPTPGPYCAAAAGLFPMQISDQSGITPNSTTIYVRTGTQYLTDATSGTWANLPSSNIPGFALPANGCVYLPPTVSARVYIAMAGTKIDINSGLVTPIAYLNQDANNVSSVYDFLEYSWTSATATMNMDVSQVDALMLPLSFQAVNSNGTTQSNRYGMQPGSVTAIANELTNVLPSPWPGLVQTEGAFKRVNNANDALVSGASAVGLSFDPTYFDAIINSIWGANSPYTAANPFVVSYGGFNGWGVYNSSTGNLDFYPTSSISGTPTYSQTKPSTTDVFSVSNTLAPIGNIYGQEMGRALGVGILRGTVPYPGSNPVQPLCGPGDWNSFYGGTATNGGATIVTSIKTDWYSARMHHYAYAPTPGLPGLAYSISDDDECNVYAPDFSQALTAGEQWNVIIGKP